MLPIHSKPSVSVLFLPKSRLQFGLYLQISGRCPQQSGAAEACWAHNPEVGGSKPSSAMYPSDYSGKFFPIYTFGNNYRGKNFLNLSRKTSATLKFDCETFRIYIFIRKKNWVR